MNATGLSVHRSCTLPDGHYKGTWGAYTVTIELGGREYLIAVDVGIRTTNAPCVVVVKDGEIAVEAI